MAGITDWPMRVLCYRMGADYACSEMVSAIGYLCAKPGNDAYRRLLAVHPEEGNTACQLFYDLLSGSSTSFPEYDSVKISDIAEKLAVRLNTENVINFVDLDSQYAIFEIELPKKWLKKTLVEVNPRVNYGMNILTIKNSGEIIYSIGGDYVFREGDQLLVFGNTERILAFTNKQK